MKQIESKTKTFKMKSKKSKKILKWIGIPLLSIISLLVAGICVVLWLVFTPARITPVVRSNLDKFITCQTNLSRVELTFFSTFPHFAIQLDNFYAVNPTDGAENDTIVKADRLQASINLSAFLFDNKVMVDGVTLLNPTVYAFTNNDGKANYKVFKQDTADKSPSSIDYIALDKIVLSNGKVKYVDLQHKMNLSATGLNCNLTFNLFGNDMDADVSLKADSLLFVYADSVEIRVESKNFNLAAKAKMDTTMVNAEAKIKTPNLFFVLNQEPYILNNDLALNTDVAYSFSTGNITLSSFAAQIATLSLDAKGSINNDSIHNGYAIQLDYGIDIASINDLLQMVPPAFESAVKGIEAQGKASLNGKVSGNYNNKSIPLIVGDLIFNKLQFSYAEMPAMPIKDASAKIHYTINLNNKSNTQFNIKDLKASALNSNITAKGTIDQVFTDPRFAGTLLAKLDLQRISKEFLDSMGYHAEGNANLQASVKTTLNQAINIDLEKITLKGSVDLSDFSANSKPDSLDVHSPQLKIDFSTNEKSNNSEPDFLVADVRTNTLSMIMGKRIKAKINDATLHLASSDFRDSTKLPVIASSYDIALVDAFIGDMSVLLKSLKGTAGMKETNRKKKPMYQIKVNTEDILVKTLLDQINANKLDANLTVIENKNESEALLQWVPIGSLSITGAVLNTSSVQPIIQIPVLQMDLKPNSYAISKSNIIIDKSDFSLTGNLFNLRPYLKGDSILRGTFSFNSDCTDLSALMTMTSAEMGSEETANDQDKIPASDNPYMVPLNMDISLQTNIKKALYENIEFKNIHGAVNIIDGKLILEDLNVDLPACKILLTAMYYTPRKNNLFLGFDYHMLNIEIKELLNMIPNLDTMMPMLRSFGGKAEFHLTAETNLFSNYDVKKSTLRSTAAISGQNLVLMDGETFTEIAKKLRFNKKTENHVDSLSVEFTLFKDEIDVYPFSILMDKYRAVVSGKHNLDMSFNYHISVVECPLPIKLGVDVIGTLDKIKLTLAKCKYAQYYRPEKQNRLVTEQLNFKKMIRNAQINSVNRREE